MPFQILAAKTTGKVRHDMMAGREYIVAPMVMLVEGVVAGSDGPLFYPAEELRRNTGIWNHKPIVVYHPMRNGEGVTACDPDVITNRSVGVIMNTKFVKATKINPAKLNAEAWIEKTRIDVVDARVKDAIEEGKMMELSTGLSVDVDKTPGKFGEKEYNGIARNYRGDHLALLPDQTGACSIKDGAGLLRNEGQPGPLTNAIKEIENRFIENELSFSQISAAVGAALRAKLGEKWMGWTEDMFDGYCVYYSDGELYRQDYHLSDADATLIGEPTHVRRVTSYEKVVATQNQAPPKELTVDKTKVIDGLIANKATKWEEADRPFLVTLNEGQLTKLEPAAVEAPVVKAPVLAPVVNTAPVVVAPAAPVVTLEALLQNADPGLRDMIQDGIVANQTERVTLIKTITGNTANTFQPADLEAMRTPQLRAIAALAAPAAAPGSMGYGRQPNYAGAAGAGPTVNTAVQEAYVSPTMNFAKADA